MIASVPSRSRWTPHTVEDREAVQRALEEILASPHFCNSKRYPALLRYVVDETLNGNGDHIKERTIGVEVFGRAPDYDTNLDTVVRYTAGEVRKRLSLYYHEAADVPIQITLSARSYLPEFFRIADETAESVSVPGAAAGSLESKPEFAAMDWPALHPSRTHAFGFTTGAILGALVILLGLAGFRVWRAHPAKTVDQFWAPVLQAKGPVLISLGGVVFSPTTTTNTQVADKDVENPFLSFENGLAMGRVAALLNSKSADYQVQSSASTTLAQIRENPVVLVGAYNNVWTQRLLQPLRFHFAAHPDEQIVDAATPGKYWARDRSKPYDESPDYALVARFRNPSTDSIVVVLAGLQRYGTDAASQFVISPRLLDEFRQRIGADWADKNIEVVLKVDVVNGRVGAPMIEAVHVW